MPLKNSPAPKEIIQRAFPGISSLEIEELLQRSQVKNYSPNTTLCQEDKLETTFYIILDGKVDVTKTINQVEQRHLTSLDAGHFFGEMALIHNAPRAATVKTQGPVTVLEIEKQDFDRVLQRSSTIAMAMVREISNRLRENDEMAIEDLKMRANELAQAYQKLAEQELTRREFLANVAHELRTPLMTAGGFLQFMQKGLVPDNKKDATIETVARNIQQITTLVNDILFLQEMDLILPKFQAVDMAQIAKEAQEAIQDKAAAQFITLHINRPARLANVSGDPKSLERALLALLDNAIKFSPGGGQVTIHLREEDGYVAVAVEDQGIGIEQERVPRIFDRFYHLERSGDNLFSGIGLGLSITQQVIKQHNGRLTVQSEPRKGSIFTIWLKAIRVIL
jgi:signal transduction histidine kinase